MTHSTKSRSELLGIVGAVALAVACQSEGENHIYYECAEGSEDGVTSLDFASPLVDEGDYVLEVWAGDLELVCRFTLLADDIEYADDCEGLTLYALAIGETEGDAATLEFDRGAVSAISFQGSETPFVSVTFEGDHVFADAVILTEMTTECGPVFKATLGGPVVPAPPDSHGGSDAASECSPVDEDLLTLWLSEPLTEEGDYELVLGEGDAARRCGFRIEEPEVVFDDDCDGVSTIPMRETAVTDTGAASAWWDLATVAGFQLDAGGERVQITLRAGEQVLADTAVAVTEFVGECGSSRSATLAL